MHTPEDGRQRFILLPALARKRFKTLIAAQDTFTAFSEASPYNAYFDGPNKELGIITTGIAFNYLSENYPDGFEHPVLKISQYPLPRKMVEKIVRECKEILVLEEGYPVVEEQLKGFLGIGIQVHGRLDGTLQRDGELTPDAVGKALGKRIESYYATPEVVEQRPPALCQGCGHRDMYEALNEVLAGYKGAKVFGDIGCYTLGALPPFRAIDTCIDMGASITMAKGASDAGVYPAVSVIGDSTFTHSGMTGLLDCVNENTNITIVISDNETTAMTGGQDSAGTGRIESICAGIGVDPAHIRVMVPLKKNYDEMKAIIREEIEYKGVSVLIPRRECIQTLTRKKKKQAGNESRHHIIRCGRTGHPLHRCRYRRSRVKRRFVYEASRSSWNEPAWGDVQSNLRLSDQPIASDLIPLGQADLIISLEPMEALRYLPYLKKDGWLVTNSQPFINIPNYPEMGKVNEELEKLPHKVVLDVEAIAKEVGSVRAANIVMLGAAAPFIGIEYDKIADGIRRIFGRKGEEIVEMNLKALKAGYDVAQSMQK